MKNNIQEIFSEVPDTYEKINHILTFGLDVQWRKKLTKLAANSGGDKWVDMCSGTGETAANLHRASKNGTQVFAVDFTREMLLKAAEKPEGKHIRFVISDVKSLPFPDNQFDVVTISFATRNLNINKESLLKSFSEFHRILKPGGRFLNLETSQPKNRFIRSIFHFFVKLFVKPIGSKISGSTKGYTYLSATIPRFYNAEELSKILKEAGFAAVNVHSMMLGAAAIHESFKSTSNN